MMESKRTALGAFVVSTLLTILMSFYYFPVGLRGILPESINTKQVIGALGALFFVLRCIRDRSIRLPRYIMLAFLLAAVFSLWCFFCCVYNNTSDYAYASYIMSFLIWIFGAFAVCEIIKYAYGRVDLPLVTKYLALACVAQCVIVLLVDNIPAVRDFVNARFIQETRSIEVKRLYGIGCSLDSGGVRMCTALVLIAHQLAKNVSVTSSKRAMTTYIVAFLVISIVGNMIARTTTVGMALGLGYIAVTIWAAKNATLNARQLQFRTIFLLLLIVGVVAAISLYNNNPEMRKQFRFAFEVFFNFVEKGEIRTASSDVLMERMWVWPRTGEEWMFGTGLFEWGWFYDLGMQTDIGYCRFSLYCGLPGLVLFALYFIYNASVVGKKFRDAGLLALILCSLTFIIWLKVSTDIFQLYALLFCCAAEWNSGKEKEAVQ